LTGVFRTNEILEKIYRPWVTSLEVGTHRLTYRVLHGSVASLLADLPRREHRHPEMRPQTPPGR